MALIIFLIFLLNLIFHNKLKEKKIIEIGKSAFSCSEDLKKVHLPSTIERIEEDAFAHCANLEYINIPSSCTFLGYRAIHCFCNFTNTSQCKDYTTKGILTVYFEPYPQIEYISKYAISRKEYINIYYFGKYSPKHEEDPFFRLTTKKVTIYAPFIRLFCNEPTVHINTCNIQQFIPRSYTFIMIFSFSH